MRYFLACCALLGLFAARPAEAQLANALTGTPSGDEAPRLHGLDLDLTLSDSSGLNAVGQNYRNELSLYLEPRWSIGRALMPQAGRWSKLTLSARFVITQALAGTNEEFFGSDVRSGPQGTCSDIVPSADGAVIDPNQVRRCNPTPAARRIDYSDLWLTAGVPRLFTLPKEIDVPASLRVLVPVSAQSRFQTLRLGLTGTSGLTRGFWQDRLKLSYALGFSKYFHAYTTPGIAPGPIGAAETGGNGAAPLTGVGISNLYANPALVGTGGFNPAFSFSNALSAHLSIADRWSGDVLYMWTDAFTYAHRCAVEVGDQTVDTCRTGGLVAANSSSDVTARGHKRGQVFWVTLSYEAAPWLDLSLAWVNWAPRLKPNSSYRQGFISTDYNAFTSVMLSASTSLDKVAARLRNKASR
jgi:hypothetical protein